MATPLTADQLLAALKAEGIKVAEHAGWRTHNRAGHGAWGPVNGVIIHHTGGTAPSDAESVWGGRSDLPGPLATAYLAKNGTLTLTANGRANHAGGGDPDVLTAVINESALPSPHEHEGSSGAADGNAHFYGLECSNLGNGKDPWPDAQYEAAVRFAAAILRKHKWTEKSAIGHKEWSDWKPDPNFSMTTFRAHVKDCLAQSPGEWTLKNTTVPVITGPIPPGKETTTMNPSDFWGYNGKLSDGSTDPRDAFAYLRGTNAGVQALGSMIEKLTAKVDALAAEVSELKAQLPA